MFSEIRAFMFNYDFSVLKMLYMNDLKFHFTLHSNFHENLGSNNFIFICDGKAKIYFILNVLG